ncbi:peptidase T [Metabacillus sp. GX 13764]|uniref:peptidase T n=1 Tax=Metabacillus kandeliae TaxID=2900151 RepID=UPI001E5F2240|nr:peptidase T [Metabacillus kandeliae]MCD7034010.1 peptidase T [Metabacillus kandeliae]
MKKELIERFTTYVKVDTQSDESSKEWPSTPGQLTLANMLIAELKLIGMEDITLDENGFVMATLPSNTDHDVPVIGFLAHMDTATDMTGKDVNPQIWEDYNGKDMILNEALHTVLSPKDFPELSGYKGHTLITTDGTTLLGADNKSGITEIMTAMNYLIQHPEIKHGKIRVAFTPDEEIGRGAHRFNVQAFGAAHAYTIDGGPLGELEYESFNAAAAKLIFKGKNVHPGTAKNKMRNAAKIAMEFNSMIPVEEAPEFTEGYEGFYHLISIEGGVEETAMEYIIRDFAKESFQARKAHFENTAAILRRTYGEENILLEIKDQYYNMREKIEPVKEIVDIAHKAMENLGITPVVKPIRGGTDGSLLSYMGLPTPNIFTGGENFHGKYEFISVDHMVKAVEVIVEVARLTAERE